MVVRQGDIFWINFGPPQGSGAAYRHPHVVIQNDTFNSTLIRTTIVCAVTSNLKYARYPGNVFLEAGEAGLPQPSVVNVTQLYTVDRDQLEEHIGTLSTERLTEVLDGVGLVLAPSGT